MTATYGQLARRLAGDLDRAFPDLVVETQRLVFNGARRWLPAREDAEDVTQEVFVRAYQALQGYSPERIAALRLRPWLFTIAVNLCRNAARARSRRPQATQLETGRDAPATAEVERDAVESVAVDEWRDRLTQLPARQRDAVVLRHVVGLSYAEISEVLGKPSGTVKSDVHRALDRLRTILAMEEL